MRVREAVPGDAAVLVALLERLDAETAFLEYEPGEFTVSPAVYAARMQAGFASGSLVRFVAEEAGTAIGLSWGLRGSTRRTRHVIHVGLGIVQAAWGRGIGRALLGALEDWSRARGVSRLELFVQTENPRAMRLYERSGFVLEGTKRNARRVAGRDVDEHVMAKLIGGA